MLNKAGGPHRVTFSMEQIGASCKSPNDAPWGNGESNRPSRPISAQLFCHGDMKKAIPEEWRPRNKYS